MNHFVEKYGSPEKTQEKLILKNVEYSFKQFFRLTHLSLVWLSVLRQPNELFGEHAAAVTQNITLQLHVRTWTHKLHHNGVTGGIDPNLHVLTPH